MSFKLQVAVTLHIISSAKLHQIYKAQTSTEDSLCSSCYLKKKYAAFVCRRVKFDIILPIKQETDY